MKLITELKQIDSDYQNGTIQITDGLTFSQNEMIRLVEFYSSSKFLNGNKGSNGRDKPFYNIVNSMVDTAVVATDIDTKDIRVEADEEGSYDKSFLFNHEIYNWMKETNFAKSLNEIGETRARYGGVVVKKCKEKGEEMKVEVVAWKNLVTDQVDILGGVIIEKHYMTPYELREKKDVWNNVEEAIGLYAKKGYTRSDERIEVWEVHGELSTDYLSDDAEVTEATESSCQTHFFCVKGAKSEHLYWIEEKDMPYKYLAWKEVSGRALGRGVVEEGEEAQVWTNDAVQKKQAAMELSGKIILKTNSKKIGNNVMTDMDNGHIVVLEEGKDLNTVNLINGALPQFTEIVQEWWSQYERVTSSYDAVRGETPPSGQPYRLQALVSQTGSSHFDYRREEEGIFLKELFYDWVFPEIKKKLTKEHILASDFTPEELMKLDESFATYEANRFVLDNMLSGKIVMMQDFLAAKDQYMQFISKDGKRRFLDIPDGYYNDMKAKLTINITGEQKNKQVVLETLTNILQTVASNPMILQDNNLMTIFNKILEMSGVSPLSLSKGGMQQMAQGMGGGQPQQSPQALGQAQIQAVQPQAVQ